MSRSVFLASVFMSPVVIPVFGLQPIIRTGQPYQIRLDPYLGAPADTAGNSLPLTELKSGQPRPPNWPLHFHPPRRVVP
jgi:hypothetical protein